MSINALRREIRSCEERIEILQSEIRNKNKVIESLRELLYKFHKQYDRIQENIYRRKRNLNSASFHTDEIRIFKSYYQEMNETLTGNQYKRVLLKQEESQQQIQKNIDITHKEIDNFRKEIRNLENKNTYLYQEIYNIEMEERHEER